MSAFFGTKYSSSERSPVIRNLGYRRKLCGLKRVIKDLVLENAYLCDEVAQVHEDTLILKEERRLLLKKLHHLEANAGIESTLQPGGLNFPLGDSQTPSPAPKKTTRRKATQETQEELNGNTYHIPKQKLSNKSKIIKEEHFDIDNTD